MNDTVRSICIAGLAVLAVALTAATLDTTVVPGGDSGENGDDGAPGHGDDNGAGTDGGILPEPSESSPGEALQIPFVSEIFTVLAILLIIGLVCYFVIYWRQAVPALVVILVVTGLLALFLLVAFDSSAGPTESGNFSFISEGGSNGESETPVSSPTAVIVLVVIGMLLVGAIAWRLGGQDDPLPPDTGGEVGTEEPAVSAIGQTAGEVADRIEASDDVDNQVYRAWKEMTDLLDVEDPDTSTPGEFAEAAIAAGLDRADVTELTRLFEDVRYGDHEATESYEQRAIAVFRRIETQYGDEENEREGQGETATEDES